MLGPDHDLRSGDVLVTTSLSSSKASLLQKAVQLATALQALFPFLFVK